MKHAKKFKEYFEDIRPVTDEELEELLNDSPSKNERNKKIKKAKKELYREH
jgi:ribosomal protein L29